MCFLFYLYKSVLCLTGIQNLKEGIKETIALLTEFQGQFRRSKLPDDEKPTFSDTLKVTKLNKEVSTVIIDIICNCCSNERKVSKGAKGYHSGSTERSRPNCVGATKLCNIQNLFPTLDGNLLQQDVRTTD